jgi:hypothetical protein
MFGRSAALESRLLLKNELELAALARNPQLWRDSQLLRTDYLVGASRPHNLYRARIETNFIGVGRHLVTPDGGSLNSMGFLSDPMAGITKLNPTDLSAIRELAAGKLQVTRIETNFVGAGRHLVTPDSDPLNSTGLLSDPMAGITKLNPTDLSAIRELAAGKLQANETKSYAVEIQTNSLFKNHFSPLKDDAVTPLKEEAAAGTDAAKSETPSLKFSLGDGKLKIGTLKKYKHLEIEGGELNLYKVGAGGAGAVYCGATDCFKAAGRTLVDEVIRLKDAKEALDYIEKAKSPVPVAD